MGQLVLKKSVKIKVMKSEIFYHIPLVLLVGKLYYDSEHANVKKQIHLEHILKPCKPKDKINVNFRLGSNCPLLISVQCL